MLTDSQWRILSTFFEGGRARSRALDDLTAALDLSKPYLSKVLQNLADEGWLERRQTKGPHGRVVEYRPRAGASIQWVSPAEGVARRWLARGEVDWRYPLVSQVPDADARSTLVTFLERLRNERYLDPGFLRGTAEDGSDYGFVHHGLTVFLYGSSATGDARPGSDVDLIIGHKLVRSVGEADTKWPGAPWRLNMQDASVATTVEALASETSLHTPRPIQARVVEEDQLVELPTPVLDALLDHGLVVYDGLRTGIGGESLAPWRFLEGGWR